MQTLKSFFIGRTHPQVSRVEASDSGLTVWVDDGSTHALDWHQVEKIFTYKVDCYAYDVIWLAFVVGKDEIHIREGVEGFEQLMLSVAHAFPHIDKEWYATVMQPPFAENFMLLYQRQSEAEQIVGREPR